MRLVASTALAIYLGGAFAAPLVHIFRDHAHSAVDAQQIDPDRFRDPITGHVDLKRLAEAVGIAGAHDESKPHTHHPGEQPGQHGANAIEHFGIAVLAAAVAVIVVVVPVPENPQPRREHAPSPTLAMRHLSAQRSTAPPRRT